MTVYCKNCGNPVSSDSKFCSYCGTLVDNGLSGARQVCSHCGAPILSGQQFCPNCGARYDGNIPVHSVNTKTCTNCGYSNSADKSYCIRCGAPLYKSNTSVAPSNRNKKKRKTRTAMASVSIVLAFCLVVNFALFPFMNSRLNTHLGIWNNYGSTQSEGWGQPPTEGDVIAEAELSEENLTITAADQNVSMTISSLCLDGPAAAQIREMDATSPFEGVELTVYDFLLDTDQELQGAIHIEIPYDPNSIAPGYTPQQCLVGIYYDAETKSWQQAHYTIDEEKQVVSIATYHLTPFGFANNIEPFTQSFSGTVDLNKKQVFTSSGLWTDAPNFGVYYTQPEGDLMEMALTYNFEVAKQIYGLIDNEAVIKRIADNGTGDLTQLNIETALSWLGKMEGVPEYGSKTVLLISDAYKGTWLESMNSKLSHVGAALSLFQLASDMYYGKSGSETAFNFLKGMIYYKGAAAVEAVFGATAGYFASWAIVGLFVYELVFGPVEVSRYIDQLEHKKLCGAYSTYYKSKPENGGAYRSSSDWFEIINALNEEAMTANNIPEGMERSDYFMQLVNQELDRYVNTFWELPASERANMVVANKDGFLYGKWGLVHFDESEVIYLVQQNKLSPDGDFNVLLWDYISNVEAIDGISISAADAYLVKQDARFDQKIGPDSNYSSALSYMQFFDNTDDSMYSVYRDIKNELSAKMRNDILTKQIMPMMREKQEEIFLRREDELKKSIETLRDELNQVIELQYVDESAKKMETPVYAGYIVVPYSEELKNNLKLMDWAAVLDNEGKASIQFTMLAHQRAGAFSQVALYKPEDKDKIYEVQPELIVDIEISGNTNVVPIKDDDFSGDYKGTLPIMDKYREYMNQYVGASAVTGNDPDIFINIKEDHSVTVSYKMDIHSEYTVAYAEFTTDSITDVELHGSVTKDGVIKIEGSAVTESQNTASGQMYEGGSLSAPSSVSMNITIDAKVTKTDGGYMIEGKVTHSTEGGEIDFDFTAQKIA